MAYAELAGLPVTAGLYAAAASGAGVRRSRRDAPGRDRPRGRRRPPRGDALAPLAVAGSPEYTALAAGSRSPSDACSSWLACCTWAGWRTTSPSRSSSDTSPASPCSWPSASCRSSPACRATSRARSEPRSTPSAHLGEANPWTIAVSVLSLVATRRPRAAGASLARRPHRGDPGNVRLVGARPGLARRRPDGPVPAGLPALARPHLEAGAAVVARSCRRSRSSSSASPTPSSRPGRSRRSTGRRSTPTRSCWRSVPRAWPRGSARACRSGPAAPARR